MGAGLIMRTSFATSIFRQAMIGMALVVVSLPVLFLAHNALGTGQAARFWPCRAGSHGRDFDGNRRGDWRGCGQGER